MFCGTLTAVEVSAVGVWSLACSVRVCWGGRVVPIIVFAGKISRVMLLQTVCIWVKSDVL